MCACVGVGVVPLFDYVSLVYRAKPLDVKGFLSIQNDEPAS